MPNNTRTTVTFFAQTKAYDESRDRIIIVLQALQTPLDENLDDTTKTLIQNLTGKWVQIPSEAKAGMTLPLKYETLTGHIRYFYAEDPRTINKSRTPNETTNLQRAGVLPIRFAGHPAHRPRHVHAPRRGQRGHATPRSTSAAAPAMLPSR